MEACESRPLGELPKHIIVCVKQVPEATEVKFDSERKTLVRDGVRNILNPYDRRAVAEAIRLAKLSGGDVTVMTMGPAQSREALTECLAAGADKAVHLMDRAFAGADTLATARALAAAIRRLPFDLIICGKQSIDAETGQVGPEVAELLDIPHITGVCGMSFDCEPRRFIAERETDEGFEKIDCALPALITAAERLVRPIKVKDADLEGARDKPIEVFTAADLSTDDNSAGDSSVFGVAGSPTRVLEIIHLEASRRIEMIEGSIQEMAETLVERLTGHGLRSGWGGLKYVSQAVGAAASGSRPDGAVLVVAELAGGDLRKVTLELLGKGKELAQRLNGEVAAIAIGGNASDHAGKLTAYGADRVYLIEGGEFAQYNPLQYCTAIAYCIELLKPHTVLIPSSSSGRDYAPRVAARLGLGLTADCIGLDLNERGELVQLKPAFGGQIVAPILSSTWPQMATVRPGMLEAREPDWTLEPRIERLEMSHNSDDRYRVVESSDIAGVASTELDDADIVICVGMGIGGPENLSVVESLAAWLGEASGTGTSVAIGGSRRVVDAGWLPRQQQIGLTGRAVAPKLYLGIGVRGNFNHTIGIQRSGLIVGINADPSADIFKAADYGIVADFAQFVPALKEALKHVLVRTQ